MAIIDSNEIDCDRDRRSRLGAIQARDPELHAWQAVDADFARRQARALDASAAGRVGSPLGIPVGVKDIFDTADLPTEYGSPIYKGIAGGGRGVRGRGARRGRGDPRQDRHHRVRHHGAGRHRAPEESAHTPGGSSSGSAAAVAAGMVRFAFGTQTVGSIIRPAPIAAWSATSRASARSAARA
jgi:amidase